MNIGIQIKREKEREREGDSIFLDLKGWQKRSAGLRDATSETEIVTKQKERKETTIK